LTPEAVLGRCTHCLLEDALTGVAPEAVGAGVFLGDIPGRGQAQARLGDYELLETLGRGGMGVVYRARQVSLDRLVAVKLLLGGAHASREERARFRQEAEVAARLQHPGIVGIHEVGEQEGQAFFSMELLPGGSLADALKSGPLGPRQAATLTKTVAEAVHYANQAGLFHRDLKPANILLTPEGLPKITDFGLAKRAGSAVELTVTGQIMGSPGFMAPEQAGEIEGVPGARTDVYGLGATLYALLTGRAPFAGNRFQEVLLQVAKQDPVPLRQLNPAVPADLEVICLRCLEKEPGRRFENAAELGAELERFLEGRPILSQPSNRLQQLTKWGRRNPALAALSLGILLAVIAGFSSTVWQWREAVGARRKAEASADLTRQANTQLATKVEELEIQRAEGLFKSGASAQAFEVLAAVVEQDPHSSLAAGRLVSALSHRRFLKTEWSIRHPGLTALELAREGERFLTASADGLVQIHTRSSTGIVTTARSHAGGIRAAALAPDGQVYAVALAGGVALTEAATGREVRLLPALDAVSALAFSAQGDRLVVGAETGALWVHDLADNHPPRQLPRHGGGIRWLRPAGDNRLLLAASRGDVAAIYDLRSGERVSTPMAFRSPLGGAEFSPDSLSVVTFQRSPSAQLWDTPSGRPAGVPLEHADQVLAARFSPEGQRLLTASKDATVRLWDIGTGKLMGRPFLHGGPVVDCDFSPDGLHFVTAAFDMKVRLWNADSGELAAEAYELDNGVKLVRFLPGSSAILLSLWDGRVYCLQPQSCQPPTEVHHLDIPFHSARASMRSSNMVFCLAAGDAVVASWDEGGGRRIKLAHGTYVTHAVADGLGRHVLTCEDTKAAVLWEAHEGKPLFSWDLPSLAYWADFSPDSRQVAIVCESGSLMVFDATDGRLVQSVALDVSDPLRVSFSPRPGELAVGNGIGNFRLVRLQTERPQASPLHNLGQGVSALAFSPDGRCLAVGTQDGAIRLWDVETDALQRQWTAHQSQVAALAFSSDGGRLASGSKDQAARVWSVKTGLPLSEELSLDGPVCDVGFLEGEDRILVLTGDVRGNSSAIWIWHEPAPRTPAPAWLASLARSAAHGEWPDALAVDSGRPDARSRPTTAQDPPPARFYSEWLRWLRQPDRQRTVSWDSSLVAVSVIHSNLPWASASELTQATLTSPNDARILAALAMRRIESANPRDAGQALYLSTRATRFDPLSSEAWEANAHIQNVLGNTNAAADAFAKASRLSPAGGEVRIEAVEFDTARGRLVTARDGVDRLLARLLAGHGNSQELKRARLLAARIASLAGDKGRYLRERLAAFGIPPRQTDLPRRLLDLSGHYNASLDDDWHNPEDAGNNLADLPKGSLTAQGVPFDVRGLIQLKGSLLESFNPAFPERSDGLPVDQRCERLHFLMGTGWADADGVVIAKLRFHYIDGTTQTAEVRYGRDVRDWAIEPGVSEGAGAAPAWIGTQERWRDRPGWGVRLYKFTWTNPRPELEVRTVDFVSAMSQSAPFLIAVTAQ
jgi:serine/threonine protein kinase/WD40 repeat protein/Tfp pilus assembly protein PilF